MVGFPARDVAHTRRAGHRMRGEVSLTRTGLLRLLGGDGRDRERAEGEGGQSGAEDDVLAARLLDGLLEERLLGGGDGVVGSHRCLRGTVYVILHLAGQLFACADARRSVQHGQREFQNQLVGSQGNLHKLLQQTFL